MLKDKIEQVMSFNMSKSEGFQPVISLVSIIILGVIIAEYIVQNDTWTAPIIIFSFLLGLAIAVIELRLIIKKNRTRSTDKPDKKEELDTKERLARFVADLFDEDIEFENEEIQNESEE